jgi:LDH2 family malate/lactate/ureidoglycolate dehydrogenase
MVEVLAGILSGAGHARPDPGPEEMNGMFILALDVAWFLPPEEFRSTVSRLTTYIKSARPLPGGDGVRIPGEKSREEARGRRREGIILNQQTWEKLAGVLRDLGLDTALPAA